MQIFFHLTTAANNPSDGRMGQGRGGGGPREEPSGYNQTFVKPVCLPAAWSAAPQRKPKET